MIVLVVEILLCFLFSAYGLCFISVIFSLVFLMYAAEFCLLIGHLM